MSDPKLVEQAIKALDSVREEWLSRQEVVGCDVGYNYVEGVRTDEIVLRAHVHWEQQKPDSNPFPAKIGDFRVVVVEANYGLDEIDGPEPY